MFRSKHKLKPIQYPFSFSRFISFVKRTRCMSAKIIHDQSNQFNFGIMLISDLFDELSPINLTLSFSDFHFAESGQRFTCEKNITHA